MGRYREMMLELSERNHKLQCPQQSPNTTNGTITDKTETLKLCHIYLLMFTYRQRQW
jgi:hypothetical protein